MQQEQLVDNLLKRFAELENLRRPWEKYWEEIRKYTLPNHKDFSSNNLHDNNKVNKLIFDSTASLALEKFASALDGMLTPRTQLWHGLRTDNDKINQLPEVREWFEQTVDILFNLRYAPKANFATSQYENYLSLGAFGTSVMFIEADNNQAISYRSIPLSQVYLAENNFSRIDTVFRKFSLTARQAQKQWSDIVLDHHNNQANHDNCEQTYQFLHCVFPASELSHNNNNYVSIYLDLKNKKILQTGHYRNFPYVIARYITNAGEIYGRSPAMTVLADIKMLNEMEKTQLRAIHQQLCPPLLTIDAGIIKPITLTPGAINYGGMDNLGNVLVKPLLNGAHIEVSESKMQQKRHVINEAFLVHLFEMLVSNNNMTATEILRRTQEKGLLLAPMIGRQQSESLDSLIERELDIAFFLQLLPPMPEILCSANVNFSIIYDSPINRLQRSYKAESLNNTLSSLSPFISADPNILNIFDVYQIVQQLADVYGLPESMLKNKTYTHNNQQQGEGQC